MDVEELLIRHYPNREVISILLPREISSYKVEIFSPPISEEMEARLDTLGTIGGLMTREILRMPGIREVNVRPKELRIRKDKAFEWPPIEKALTETIQRALKRKGFFLVATTHGK